MKKFSLSFFICLFTFSLLAQKKDDPVVFDNAFLISPSYQFQLPLNDMFHSYGFNHNVGMEFGYKFGANWMVGVEGNFIFGPKIKDKYILDNLLTTSGYLIGTDGSLEPVNMNERGMILTANFGKTIYFSPKQPNSGLLLKFGLGYIDHKIYIDVNDKNVPQLSKEIKKGYDRFTSGVAFKQYVGLIKLQKKSYLNLSFGIEATEGITQNRRPYDFVAGRKLDKARFDFLIGFKFNWFLPVFNGASSKSEYYYY